MKSEEIDEIKQYLSVSVDYIYRMQGITKDSRKAFINVVNNLLDDYKEQKILQ